MIAYAPSGKIVYSNSQAQQISEQVHRQTVPPELRDHVDCCRDGDFEMLHPDGRPYEAKEWPLMRSIRSGEEVKGEEFVHLGLPRFHGLFAFKLQHLLSV